MNELKLLYKTYNDKTLTYPRELVVKHPHGLKSSILETRYHLQNRRIVLRRIREIENAKKGIHGCFFCRKYYKEDKGGRWLPMDKRESGDNGWGDTFTCYKCIPKEYGRL